MALSPAAAALPCQAGGVTQSLPESAPAMGGDGRQRDHAWIVAHVPHQGSMCLLEQVLAWDGSQLLCRAVSHRDPANPLRAAGRLGAASGIEYAAQAMALHGALLAPRSATPRAGFLASVRSVILHVQRLDDIETDLAVQATRFSGDENNVLYNFSISAAGRLLLEGRAAVILDAGDGRLPFMASQANPATPAAPSANLKDAP